MRLINYTRSPLTNGRIRTWSPICPRPTLPSSSLRPPERSSPSVCTWALERPAGPSPFGLGIYPGQFFPKLSMSKCPWFTDGLNCLSVGGRSSRVFLSPAGLSPVCLCQLGTKALCVRMSLLPNFHRRVWERTELTFTHTHTYLVTPASFRHSLEF